MKNAHNEKTPKGTEAETTAVSLRRTQAELETARARYFDLYDLAPVGFTFSENGLVQETNQTAATLLCAGRAELVGRPISQFILKEDQSIFYPYCKQPFAYGEPKRVELRIMIKDKTTLWVLLEAVIAQDAVGATVCRRTDRLAREYPGEIHLLVTDVLTPEMNGWDLAKNMLSLYPLLNRLFMSGYTADIIAQRGVLDAGVRFIQKPFTTKVLTDKVREAISQKIRLDG